ncbi:diaminopropionate ammonia-lyase [Nitritalea halalkaliphila LW7]|uniref:Diaminopropionate ammonia-lyase n=1 Tax=Nitritalea halalkaliphila LW7 TaxID=1189621 RepID=I5C5H9_9BACT|nr:pyridoxal-phosphate dependent enzyme [Nitritalea halalkaliphila]EIM77081.1 diaminopropionate ammonia-lyase [Nitritalea halalkaliphila LW7]
MAIRRFYLQNPDFNIGLSAAQLEMLQDNRAIAYHERLPAYRMAPVRLQRLAHCPAPIFIKDESERFGLQAFKALGASYALHRLLEREPSIQGVCTATDGNHGRSLAWSAAREGLPALIFVPREVSAARKLAIEKEGAEVQQLDLNYDETVAFALAQSQVRGLTCVQDTAWEGYTEIPSWIMAGYRTHLIELERQGVFKRLSQNSWVFLQVGVGSWAAAVALYLYERFGREMPQVLLVEPEGSAGFLSSLEAGYRRAPEFEGPTTMGGLQCGIPSSLAWPILRALSRGALTISEEAAAATLQFFKGQVDFGASGVAGMAAVRSLVQDSEVEKLREALHYSAVDGILVFNTEGALLS